MSKSIFSTYSQGENRVTSTMLSVFRKINLSTFQEILKYVLNDVDITLVLFKDQYKEQGMQSIPDARISASFDYFIETKIVRDSLTKNQLEGHLEYLGKSDAKDVRLLLVTPDSKEPKIMEAYRDRPVFWFNFDLLSEALQSVLDNYRFLTDREKFLLLELDAFIVDSNLLSEDISNKVLIIPSSKLAFKHYDLLKVYICQPNRTFQQASYIGHYGYHVISKEVPKILGVIEDYNLVENQWEEAEITAVDTSMANDLRERLKMISETLREQGLEVFHSVKIVLLSRSAEEGTVFLPNDITNDKMSYSGKKTAYVQKQVYEDLEKMKKAKFTSELRK